MACVVHSSEIQAWLQRLQGRGIVPPEVTRIIIDIPLDDCVRVYYECLADEAMFSIEMADMLSGAEVISVTGGPEPKLKTWSRA